jgi:hypothetical protein
MLFTTFTLFTHSCCLAIRVTHWIHVIQPFMLLTTFMSFSHSCHSAIHVIQSFEPCYANCYIYIYDKCRAI